MHNRIKFIFHGNMEDNLPSVEHRNLTLRTLVEMITRRNNELTEELEQSHGAFLEFQEEQRESELRECARNLR